MQKKSAATASPSGRIGIKNWSRFQHFKDRRPPWIKLYRDLLDDINYFALGDKAARYLPLIWLIASEQESGILPRMDAIAFRLRLTATELKAVMDELAENGFLVEGDAVGHDPQPITAKDIAARHGFGSRHISDVTKRLVWDRDGGKCKECEATKNIEYDHIHPVSKGGNSEPSNIQLLCRPCNRRKRAKSAERSATHAQPLRSLETETEREKEGEREAEPEERRVRRGKKCAPAQKDTEGLPY